MELYDKMYVYFDWDDVLEGKKGFFSNSISELKQHVEDNKIMYYGEICKDTTVNTDFPFEFTDDNGYTHLVKFCYYDPYYEVKRAYNEGKQIQYRAVDTGEWCDCFGYPSFFPNSEYRIKPEAYYVECSDTLGFVIVTKRGKGHCYWNGTRSDCLTWIEKHKHLKDIVKAYEKGKMIQFFDGEEWKDCWNPKVSNGLPLWGADVSYRVAPDIFYAVYNDNNIYKTKSPDDMSDVLFGSSNEEEVDLFIDNHIYLEEIIKAGRKGKTIQFKEFGVSNDPWREITGFNNLSLHDFVHYEYRIQPEKRVPFDTVQELITHWEGMNPGCTNRPKCAMPMIWVKSKSTECIYLIDGYDYNDNEVSMCNCWFPLDSMFKDYTFINDSIIGKRDK